PVRVRADQVDLPQGRFAPRCESDAEAPEPVRDRAPEARAEVRRVRRAGRARAETALPLHVPLRAGDEIQQLLRELPGLAERGTDAVEPIDAVRRDREDARVGTGSAGD